MSDANMKCDWCSAELDDHLVVRSIKGHLSNGYYYEKWTVVYSCPICKKRICYWCHDCEDGVCPTCSNEPELELVERKYSGKRTKITA